MPQIKRLQTVLEHEALYQFKEDIPIFHIWSSYYENVHFPATSARYHPAAIAAPKTFNLGQRMSLQREAALYDYAANCINSPPNSAVSILFPETHEHVLSLASPQTKNKGHQRCMMKYKLMCRSYRTDGFSCNSSFIFSFKWHSLLQPSVPSQTQALTRVSQPRSIVDNTSFIFPINKCPQ